MSGNGDLALTELAGAILDGSPIDWESADSDAAPEDRPVVRRLKSIAAIARAHHGGEPETWGSLRLLEPIGRGAFGDVYRAWDSRLDRQVALKLLAADPSASNQLATSMIEEGRLLARVRHPNVVTIYGAERIEDRVGLWMEYIDGRTLHQLVVEDGRPFSPREVAAIGQALCGAVAAVHAAGLLHRDIKAQNVMMARDGRVVLMDFGSGRDRGGTSEAALAGTPLYLAPEVLSRGSPPSVQSDIYSTGVLLYFLLTGTYPVTGVDLGSLREAHERGERPSLRTVAPAVPWRLGRAVARAIDPNHRGRYASAEALSADLGHTPSVRWRVIAGCLVAAALVLVVLVAAKWATPHFTSGDRAEAASSPTGLDASRGRYATNLANYEDSLRARALVEKGSVTSLSQAVKLFERIVASDPRFAPAHAGVALAYAFLSMSPYQGVSHETARPRIRAAASEALRLDPMLAEAHTAQGWVHAREFEWIEAERAFRRAIELNPGLIVSYTSFSISTLQPLGRVAEAEQLLRQAERTDPFSEQLKLAIGRVLLQANRPAELIALLEPVRRTDSDTFVIDQFIGRALMLEGRAADALPLLDQRRRRLVDPTSAPEPWLAGAYALLGRRAEAEKLARDYDHLPFRRAIINAALGNSGRMFHGLEEMAEREPQRLAHLLRAPEFAAYRHDERFMRLLQQMKLDP